MSEWPDIMKVKTAAKYCDCGLNEMYELIAQGRVPHVHIGTNGKEGVGTIRVHRRELDSFVSESHKHDASR